MAQRSRLDLVDQIIKGGAAKYLQEARDSGQSFETIAADLTHLHNIATTGRTVARWCAELGIDTAKAAS